MDLGWLVHGFSTHGLITGLGITTLVVAAKEIDHVLIDGHWRMIQNCRVYQSAQLLNTDKY